MRLDESAPVKGWSGAEGWARDDSFVMGSVGGV